MSEPILDTETVRVVFCTAMARSTTVDAGLWVVAFDEWLLDQREIDLRLPDLEET